VGYIIEKYIIPSTIGEITICINSPNFIHNFLGIVKYFEFKTPKKRNKNDRKRKKILTFPSKKKDIKRKKIKKTIPKDLLFS
jgi:hypothetical protein